MLHRFYVPDLTPDFSAVPLPPDEAEHLTKVLRLRVGETVAVFDGRGNEYLARVESVGRRLTTVRPVERRKAVREPVVALTLGQAILKSDKMDRVIRDAVMLGVAAVQPFSSARTEIPRAALRARGRNVRWQRIVTASVKQCGRAVVPPVREVVDLPGLLAAEKAELRLLLVEPANASGSVPGSLEWLKSRSRPSTATVLIGPEGGWEAGEIDAVTRAGFLPVTLGVRTLRADAAGVAAIAVLQFIWGEL